MSPVADRERVGWGIKARHQKPSHESKIQSQRAWHSVEIKQVRDFLEVGEAGSCWCGPGVFSAGLGSQEAGCHWGTLLPRHSSPQSIEESAKRETRGMARAADPSPCSRLHGDDNQKEELLLTSGVVF
jgi:hypothetical protein